MLYRALILVTLLVATARAEDRTTDEHSYAEPTKVRTKKIDIALTVDFAKKQLVGTATLHLEWVDKTAKQLVLDTRDLTITKVEMIGEKAYFPTKFTLGKRDPILGSKLTIEADGATGVKIHYKTSPKASGLQWMPAKLTANGKAPFMFSQSQAIHARSWVPLQDTPNVRFTYEARIKTPKTVVAVMSADNDPKMERDGDYEIRMPQAIPSYLLAIAVGDLAFKPISNRCGVWAEPPIVDKAVAELADTESMIQAAEKLFGPYQWGRYDILMLPASFPFGGMENPRLSFITPTILVGDKSLTSLIAHELAHSWSGNLVTNASWKDVWLNEGFTTYFENRIVEVVYGKDFAEIERTMTLLGLKETIAKSSKDKQVLRIPASPGKDPEDLTDVAYEKGNWFLFALEQRYGRALFDPFLKEWFTQHAFTSVTTDDFTAFIRGALVPKKPKAMPEAELVEWVESPGLPATAPTSSSARLVAVDELRTKWLAGGKLVIGNWSTHERIHFLDHLPKKLTAAQLDEIDAVMKLTGTTNGEFAQRWYPLTIRSDYKKTRPAILAFIERVGRRKLINPIYRAFAETPEGLAFAKKAFAKFKANYHPLTVAGVEEALTAKPARP